MARSWCWVCDGCGTHQESAQPSSMLELVDGKRERLPHGWVLVEESPGVVTPVYCSLLCATKHHYSTAQNKRSDEAIAVLRRKLADSSEGEPDVIG